MRVTIRADASIQIGSGHVMRCLTLADALREQGAEVCFICRELPGHLGGVLADKGYPVRWLPALGDDGTAIPAHTAHSAWLGVPRATDAEHMVTVLQESGDWDWLVVDHYGLDARWESRLRPRANRLMAIDDLADRPHDVDVLLDPSPTACAEGYRALAPPGCRLLLGLAHALLRPEFAAARGAIERSFGTALTAHLAFGGTDPGGQAARVARWLLDGLPELRLRVLVGAATEPSGALAALDRDFAGRFQLERAPGAVAPGMALCDVALGAPGGALWERFCMGLPSACFTTHPTQRPVVARLAAAGWLLDLGPVDERDHATLARVAAWLGDTAGLAAQRHRLMAAVDGLGAARVAALMEVAG
ncbi:MAG: UDP-2,4-diacetamido-2,4,6-trideoxy-beta-L-altropyranose hydrolase [Candidatus Competibacter sp.]|nr:UDP-2,4-diacetamido-2,4,6-trideoxy-beta-L-altropyranose hydrolase [Candidatus Competibacter sp.]